MTPQNRFAQWIESRSWVFAKTMPQWPHEYSSIRRTGPRKDDNKTIAGFEAAVVFVREQGMKLVFKPTGSRFIYYPFDKWMFWTMGWPVHMTVVMNRCLFDPTFPLHLPVQPRGQKRELGGGVTTS